MFGLQSNLKSYFYSEETSTYIKIYVILELIIYLVCTFFCNLGQYLDADTCLN